MQITPMKDLLLIELQEKENKTASGLIFKEAWESAQNKAVVKRIGPDVTLFKEGDKIVINPYAMLDVTINAVEKREVGERQYLIRERDVLATWQ